MEASREMRSGVRWLIAAGVVAFTCAVALGVWWTEQRVTGVGQRWVMVSAAGWIMAAPWVIGWWKVTSSAVGVAFPEAEEERGWARLTTAGVVVSLMLMSLGVVMMRADASLMLVGVAVGALVALGLVAHSLATQAYLWRLASEMKDAALQRRMMGAAVAAPVCWAVAAGLVVVGDGRGSGLGAVFVEVVSSGLVAIAVASKLWALVRLPAAAR